MRLAKQKMAIKKKHGDSKKLKDDGLRFIGKHVYTARQQLEQQAEKLYRGKVLIERPRTRDMMPLTLNNTKLKKQLAKISKAQKAGMLKDDLDFSEPDDMYQDYSTLVHGPIVETLDSFEANGP